MHAQGLTSGQAGQALLQFGPNRLPASPPERLWRKVLRATTDPMVLILVGAAVLTIVTSDLGNTVIIAAVVVVNTVVAVRQEVGAERALAALGALTAPSSRVVRDGAEVILPVEQIVPGDLVVVGQGDLVPADGRLVDSAALLVNEATLTGESVPVDKRVATGPEDDAAEAGLLAGTAIVRGRALLLVERTGPRSAVGRIAGLLRTSHTVTPLQRRMARLSTILALSALGLCAVVLLAGLVQGQDLEVMVVTAASLAVAAVPESLPAVVTISLALAARRMARRNAIVRNLAAVETLGSVTLLATDKTGTLTQARMSIVGSWLPAGVERSDLVRAALLCNDSTSAGAGDPTDSALLGLATPADAQLIRTTYPRRAELPFDGERKRMTTMHCRPGGGHLTICKGAPERLLSSGLLDASADLLRAAAEQVAAMAARGLRVIAVADREDCMGEDGPPVETHLRLLGLLGLQDPPRAAAATTIRACKDAGIRVVLVTGDNALTAVDIAGQVGIGGPRASVLDLAESPLAASAPVETDVIARARPSDKVAAVTGWQSSGQVVAMTGDGVNDGPALRRADIGVAMGARGSEVARQAADLVLRDDELATVVAAVEEGRRVYANVRRFLLYALSGGAAEILVMLAGPLVGVPLPLLPGQILWVNLLTHSLTGTALGSEPVEPGVMSRPPTDPAEGILGRGLWWQILTLAAVIAAVAGAAAATAPASDMRSTLMLALSAAMLGVAWGSRVTGLRSGVRGLLTNPALPGAVVGSAALLVAAVSLRPLQELLHTRWPGPSGLLLALGASLLGAFVTRLLRRIA
jgi:Ca2+-transporting ATPase